MNKREMALKVARYSETTDKLNWISKWRDMVKVETAPSFPDRYELYKHLQERIGSAPITYLEFGVATGKSMRAWVANHRHPDSRFHGFDTFEGMPEDWRPDVKKGHFSTGGVPPAIDDPRVTFHKGLFQQTLRPFLAAGGPPRARRLVVHLDADLYSATLYALTQLDGVMPAGTIIVFDEFQSFLHEFRGWHDYISAYQRTFEWLGFAHGGVHTALELI
jgi:hypothetical protein